MDGCHFQVWGDIRKQPIDLYLGGLSLSNRTHNGYVAAIKEFCNWAVENDKVESSPLVKLKRVKVQDKEKRRPLSFNEVCRLLAVAQNGPVRHGLTGPERAILYVVAISTGFRRHELFHLAPACFDLNRATVNLDAAYCKNRQDADQPISLEVAARLTDFLAGKAPTEPVFRLKTPRTCEMLQEDAIEAKIPLKDEKGRELVFHSLRHTLRTELVAARVSNEVIDAVMRHAPNGVGQRFYGHVADFQKREAIARLPEYLWPTDLQAQAVRTGTDNVSELYGQKYAMSTPDRTPSVKIRQSSGDGTTTAALALRDQGLCRTSEPMVGGASSSGRSTQAVGNSAITRSKSPGPIGKPLARRSRSCLT